MPNPGNEEPGVLSPQLEQQHQFSNFSGSVPIKKRRFPVIRSPSPSPEERTCCLEDNVPRNKEDSDSQDGRLSTDISGEMGHPGKVEESKSGESIVKEEQVTDTHVGLAQENVNTTSLKPQETSLGVGLGPIDASENKQKMLLDEKSSPPGISESRVVTEVLNIKQETVSGTIEGACQLVLPTCPNNDGLLFGANKQSLPVLGPKISEGIGHMSGKSDLSSLSLALSREMLVSHDSNNTAVSDISSLACVKRSNWDLNTTMDAWEGSVNNEAYFHKAAGIGGFSKTIVGHDLRTSLSASLGVGVKLIKENQVLDEHSSNSSNASVQRSQLYKPNDILSLSLSIPCREFDSYCEHSSLSDNMGSESVDSKVNLVQLQLPNMNMTFSNVGNVKLETVDENPKLSCSTGISSNFVSSKLASVKKEGVENRSTDSIIPDKSVGYRSLKTELVQGGIREGCVSKDTMLSQSIAKNRKIMQHQDSSASSSVLSVPLISQNSSPSSLTFSELHVSSGLLNRPEPSLPSKEFLGHRCIPEEHGDGLASNSLNQNDKQLMPCKTEELIVRNADNCRVTPVVRLSKLCGNSEIAANNEEKSHIPAEIPEKSTSQNDCKSHGNHKGEKFHSREDDDYEDGEIREPLKDTVGEGAMVVEVSSENVVLVEREEAMVVEVSSENVVLVERDCTNTDQIINAPFSDGNVTLTENDDETVCNDNKECSTCSDELQDVDKILQSPLSDKLKEVDTFGKKSVSVVTLEKPLDLLGRKDVNKGDEKELSATTNESHSIDVTLDGDAIDKVVNCPVNNDSTLSEVKAPADGSDAVKDSNGVASKSRIINLPRAPIASTPCKTRSLSSRLLTTKTGRERYSQLDGDRRPRWNRDELYIDDPNKCEKDRLRGSSFRNSRNGFMLGKGRACGRFGRLHNEWDSDRDYAPETCNGRPDHRVFRHKQSSAMADELEHNGYGIASDDASLCSGRKKTINEELPSLRRPSTRRLSPGDVDGQITRNIQIPRRFPRNASPSRYAVEDGSEFVGLRHEQKFLRHLSDDIIDPVFRRQRTRYDELDGQLRRNRNFAVHRRGYPRICSKSPVRSRTRSPVPWSSPRQRSPNGIPDSSQSKQQRSPVLYRMGRMRSPEHASCRDEMVPRRHVSPSYVTQHVNDMKDFDFEREHVHPRPMNSSRRSPPRRLFPRSTGRANVLDSRERADSDEYSNRSVHSNRFQELGNDDSVDERRHFSERRGFVRPFRSIYETDSGNYHLHLNDGPKPYRFYQDTDTEFVERNNMREREFDGHIKHLSASRRMRDIEKQQDGSHRPGGRVWHDDGFPDVSRVKRRRF